MMSRSLAVICVALCFIGPAMAGHNKAHLDDSESSNALVKLHHKPGERPVVTVYEVRSEVPEIQPRATRDMFITALIKSGAFTVAERARLNEGVMRERQTMSSGLATGTAHTAKIAGAQYIFEVAISEASAGTDKSEHGLNIGGMDLGHASSSDEIGMDIRIVDVTSGTVIDSVNVVQQLQATQTQVSGVGNLASSLLALGGRSLPVSVDASSSSSHSDSVDRALRACIETGVRALVQRFDQQ